MGQMERRIKINNISMDRIPFAMKTDPILRVYCFKLCIVHWTLLYYSWDVR